MEVKLTKELVKELMANKDEIRGIDFKTDEEFILQEKGKEGLKKVEEKMAELGHPVKYKDMSSVAFYPIGLRVLCLLVYKELFGFDDKKIKEMGREAPKGAIFIKVLMVFAPSVEKIKHEVRKTWQRYHTTGELELIAPKGGFETITSPGHEVVLRLKGHCIHPLYCIYLEGYWEKVCKMMINAPASCKEVKCPFKGDDYHECVLRW